MVVVHAELPQLGVAVMAPISTRPTAARPRNLCGSGSAARGFLHRRPHKPCSLPGCSIDRDMAVPGKPDIRQRARRPRRAWFFSPSTPTFDLRRGGRDVDREAGRISALAYGVLPRRRRAAVRTRRLPRPQGLLEAAAPRERGHLALGDGEAGPLPGSAAPRYTVSSTGTAGTR